MRCSWCEDICNILNHPVGKSFGNKVHENLEGRGVLTMPSFFVDLILCAQAKIEWQRTRDGHANTDDAEVCGLMRICGCDSEDKICMRIVGKKTRSKIEQNWGAGARTQKRLKFLTKIVKNLSKIGQKMGPKWWFFYYCDVEMRIFAHRYAMIAHRQKLLHDQP